MSRIDEYCDGEYLTNKDKTLKEHLVDTICSVRKGSMDDNQFRATVEHNMDLLEEPLKENIVDLNNYTEGIKFQIEELKIELQAEIISRGIDNTNN